MNTQQIIHQLEKPDFNHLTYNPFFGFSFDMDLIKLPKPDQDSIIVASFQFLKQLTGNFNFPLGNDKLYEYINNNWLAYGNVNQESALKIADLIGTAITTININNEKSCTYIFQIIRVLYEAISTRWNGNNEDFFDKELVKIYPSFIVLTSQILNAKKSTRVFTEHDFKENSLPIVNDYLTKVFFNFWSYKLINEEQIREYISQTIKILYQFDTSKPDYLNMLINEIYNSKEKANYWAITTNLLVSSKNEDNERHSYLPGFALDSMSNNDFSNFRKILPEGIKILEPLTKNWTYLQFDFFVEYFVYYPLSDKKERTILVAKSKERFALVDMIVRSERNLEKMDELKQLLIDVAELKKPKLKVVSKEKGIEFEDFNFKLAVIEQLMYLEKYLKPKFSIHNFAKNHIERDINIEDEGYEIIPEAKQFFEELILTTELLSNVTEIDFEFGGSEIAHSLIPFWDGEDDVFEINCFEDFKHLPNLKTVFNGDGIDPDMVKELKAKGVKIK